MQNRIVVTVLSLLLVLCTGVTGCSAKSAEETKKSSTEETEKKSKKTEESKKTEGFDETRLGFYTNGSWGMDIKSIDNKQKRLPMMDMRMEQEKRPVEIRQVRLLMTIRWISMESLLNGKEILLKLKMRRMC